MNNMKKIAEKELYAVKTENGIWREELCLKKAVHMLLLYLKTIGGKRDYRGRWEGNKRKERLQNSPVAGGCVRRYYGCFTSFG